MHRARHLLWILALVALTTAPAANATSVTVQISGTWSAVADTASVLDGSVVAGSSFVASLVYNDAVPDLDPSSGFGAYSTPAASSDLSIVTGNYTFTPGSSVGIGVENNNDFGEDWTYIDASSYTATGPFPVGVGTGATAYANATLTDFTGTAHSNDALVGLNWVLGDYQDSFFYLFVQITGRGAAQYIEFQGSMSDITVLPEPSMPLLIGLVSAAIALARRRG